MGFLDVSVIVWIAVLTNCVAALSFYVSYAAGTLNVSQAGFMAIGGYSVAVTSTQHDGSIWPGIVIGIGLAAAAAWILGLITLRLSGIYLAMATLSFVIVVQQVITINSDLGGAVGLSGIPSVLTWPEALAVLAVVCLLVHGLMGTRLGYQIRMAREDVVTARATGVNIGRLRMKTLVLSGVLAAVAGAMYALQASFVGPGDFGFPLVIAILSYAIVGGTDRWWGPVLGACVLTLLPELTQTVQVAREILTGALVLGVLVLFPEGIVGFVLRLRTLWRSRLRPVARRPDPQLAGAVDHDRTSHPEAR